MALSLCFAIGPLSAIYHACEVNPPAQQEAQADQAEVDCAAMGMNANAPSKAEKQCCVDFSCLKCFSSPLTTAQQEPVAASRAHTSLVDGTSYGVASHRSGGIDRPPKRV